MLKLNKSKKNLLFIILLAFFMQAVSVSKISALDVPEHSDLFYVNDFAHLLTQQTQDYIVKINDRLCASTGAQVVVTTIESLEGDVLEEFATRMFREYGIGDGNLDNGVLILISEGDRKIRIEVGYGLEGVINDAKAGRILDDYVVPFLKENKWDEGVVNCFNAVVKYIQNEYDVNTGANEPFEYVEPKFYERADGQILIGGAISIFVGVIIYKIFKEKLLLPILLWIVLTSVYFMNQFSILAAIGNVFTSGIATLIGAAIGMPDDYSSYGSGGSSSSYGSSSGYSSSGSSSYSSSGSSSRSGGGGSSGGGGASRGF